MKIDITGRQIEITPALRDFTMEKLRKLEKLLDGPLEVHVVLAVEKHRHLAEIQVKSRTAVLSGTEETGDLYASIGEVAEKLERQALKHKEKVTEKKRREGTRLPEAVAALETRSAAAADSSTREELPAQILESRRYRLKPLSAEDAVMELEATGEDILVYRDSRSYRVNVVYRRKDNHFGLVDPEF
jgi:putative sigma-54 modulation protein